MISLVNVKRYCKEYWKIENYEKAMNDLDNIWFCHHRLETHSLNGEKLEKQTSIQELKELGLYYNRPSNELVFLTCQQHRKVHALDRHGKLNTMYGKKHKEETKKKLMLSNKCRKRILCIELNIEFESVREAARHFDVYKNSIQNSLHKGYKCKGYTFKIID